MKKENLSISLAIAATVFSVAALYISWAPFPSVVSSAVKTAYDILYPSGTYKKAFVESSRDKEVEGPPLFDKLVAFGADAASLRYLPNSSNYVRDAKYVYWVFPFPRRIEGADPKTFTVLGNSSNISNAIYATDKAHLYVTGILAEGVDPKTFERVGNTPYFRDNQSLYYEVAVNTQGDYRYGLKKIPGIDRNTVHTLSNELWLMESSALFIADATHVYLRGEMLPDVDAATFHPVVPPYFADKHTTYFFENFTSSKTNLIPLAATSTIRIFTNTLPTGGYIAIGNQMFFGTTSMPYIDARSFRVFDADVNPDTQKRSVCSNTPSCPYTADASAVYYEGVKIVGADPSSFEPLGYGLLIGLESSWTQPKYARDAARVYYQGKVVTAADPKTFVPLINGRFFLEYGRDARAAYWHDAEIVGADPATFRIFGGQQPYEGCGAGPYTADAHSLFFGTKRVVGADPATFQPFINDYGRDKNGIWLGTEFKPNLPSNFVPECNYG